MLGAQRKRGDRMVTPFCIHVRKLESAGLFHRAGTDAARAGLDIAHTAVVDGANLLQVRLENLLGLIVGVADIAAAHRFLAAHVTYIGHDHCPPCQLNTIF